MGGELPSEAEFPPSHDTDHVLWYNGVSRPLRLLCCLLGTLQPWTYRLFLENVTSFR